jgi:hypothetical protein
LYSECKIFWEIPSKRNRVLERESEKEEAETNSGLTIHSPNLVHLKSTGLQEVEGCFDFKPPHREVNPFHQPA